MGYLPSNPYNAIVNCKIGDLSLTPIPPNSLESFTFERDTSTGGNKFTIVVHDETAILIESYLAETAAKGNEGQSYDFAISGIPKDLLPEDTRAKSDETLEATGGAKSDSKGSDDESDNPENKPDAQSIGTYARVLQVPGTLAIGGGPEPAPLADDGSNPEARADTPVEIKMRGETGRTFSKTNQSTLRGGSDETNAVFGSTGPQTSVGESPDRADEVERTVIDNSQLVYANPSYGLREIYGVKIPEGVWMSEDALKEHSGGRGDG